MYSSCQCESQSKMADRRTTTFMLAGVPFVILAGIISQVVSLATIGITHRFAIWYVVLMVILFLANLAALAFHLAYQTARGVLLAAWLSLLCVSAMVWLDTIIAPDDGLPWILLTLYLAAYAVGEVVGGRASTLYSAICGLSLFVAGIAQSKFDDTLPMLLVLLLVTVWSWRSHFVCRRLEKMQMAVEIITDAKRQRHPGSN